MRFENLQYLIFFGLIPVFIYFFIWRERRRRQDLQRFAELTLLNKLQENYRTFSYHWRNSLFLLGICLIIFALLGPQWGYKWETITYQGVDIIMALDTSKSMLAEDTKPNRLERSKLIIYDLLDQLTGDRLGLITFAGTSFLQVPLTIDYNTFMQGVQSLRPELMPQGGTALGQAMENALEAFQHGPAENRLLILITDGENHLGDPIRIAERLVDAGINLLVIGMGTSEGELIPLLKDGYRHFLKDDNGNVIKTRLDEELLKNIAFTAQGAYITGNDLSNIALIYDQYINIFNKNVYTTTKKKNYYHRYQIFLLLGILLICAELLLGTKKERVRR